MRHVKSERLKKLESELNDLDQWLKLGLVPKKDIPKHKEEIRIIQGKIEEEKERLQFLKESGEAEEYITPKRPSVRAGYTEMPTIPDIDIGETAAGGGDTGFEMETEGGEGDTSIVEERDEEGEEGEAKEEGEEAEEEEESPFSDRNRWRRGGIIDPDADEW
ncbi:MAG: hypothetical protein H0X51_03180 [Parachlamydiaceae bacterium]|nr:hypothetical protein [Parachlamydiaceae bacterium]